MVNYIIVGHGQWPEAMKDIADIIYGEVSNIKTVMVNEVENVDTIKKRIDGVIDSFPPETDILVLLDLMGGSPSHAVSYYKDFKNIRAVTGANVGMLLSLLTSQQTDIDSLVELAIDSGKNSIIDLFDLINQHI